jgi:DNA mismatch repair protein MutL
MGKIIQLDEALSNQIAAGEVVERPASVVKELVENSIDANSTRIEIDLEEAGLASIRILDNGDGMSLEDAKMAFNRHATSKIKDENDLFRIRTLGFRGEALPSIASVSKLSMKTSDGLNEGCEIQIEGGRLVSEGPAPLRKGTDLVIQDLFYNTPARLKYMKTIHTELGNITDMVNRLALSHPNVSFQLRQSGKTVLQTSGNGHVDQVLATIYGTNTVKSMIKLSEQSLDFTLSAYITLPEVTRASRNYLSTMVNGRFIKNYPLVKAIQEGYHTLLPIGRFPIGLFMIEMDPILVDVNVHPSKMEVRFSKEKELNQFMTNTIREAFREQTLIPSGYSAPVIKKSFSEQSSFDMEPEWTSSKTKYDLLNSDTDFVQERFSENKIDVETEQSFPYSDSNKEESVFPEKKQETAIFYENFGSEKKIDRVPPLYPIGQMHGTYIFAQNEHGLYMIDQHAAQERIKYEFFKEKVGNVERELQELLVPITIEFTADQAMKIKEYAYVLETVGVFLEEFGSHSFLVRSHPQWFPKGEEVEVIEEMIEQLLSMKRVDVAKLREEAAIMMSCKGSIKANRHLRNDEIQALLNTLRKTNDPFTCPHGRPIMIQYSTYELEKLFKRIQ